MRRYLPWLLALLLTVGCAGRQSQVEALPERKPEPPPIEITGLLGRSDPSSLTMDEVAEGLRAFIGDRPLERLKVLYDRWYPQGWRPEVLEADLNGDGRAEIITAPRLWGPNRPITGAGTLIVIYQKDGGWAVDRLPGDEVQGIFLYAATELTGEPSAEIVWGPAQSGAHTANYAVFVSQWAPGAFTTLPGRMEMATMQLEIEGRDLVLRGGLIGSVGAGPQRGRTDRYRWTGAQFDLVDRSYDAGDWGYWRLVDGMTHERFGRAADAEGAYREAMDPQRVVAPPDVVVANQAGSFEEAVRALARFRLVAMLLGQSGRASEAAALVASASGPYADLVRAAGSATGTEAACGAGAAWAEAHPAFLAALNGLFGYANQTWRSEKLCGMVQ